MDGIAVKQIETLNSVVNAARDEIIAKYQPDEHESTMHLLKVLEIQEGDYFGQRVHEDIDSIMTDIKKTHAQRQSKSVDFPAESIKRDIEEAMNSSEGRVETLLRQALVRLGVPYAKVTEEEKQTMLNVLRKSKTLQSGISKRGSHKRK